MAPENYYPFSAMIFDALDNSLYDEAEKYLTENSSSIMSLAMERRDDLALRWLYEYCGQQLYIASSCGSIRHIDEGIFIYNKYFVDITSSAMAGDDASFVPKDLRDDFNFCEPITKASFDAFNSLVEEYYNSEGPAQEDVDQRIREQIKEQVSSGGFTKPPLFYNPNNGRIDLRLFDFLYATEIIKKLSSDWMDLVRIAVELRPLQGWTIVVPNALIGDDWIAYCSGRCIKYKLQMDNMLLDDETKPGRPRKREKAAQAYTELYPDGLGKDSWVTAAHRVSIKTGEGVSVDTLKRGLGKK